MSHKNITAYCYASGHIRFGQQVPAGAIPIVTGPNRRVRNAIEVQARWSYPTARGGKDSAPLVPGIPEAADSPAKLAALAQFIKWVKKSLEVA